jgi:thymidylate kinase
VIKVLETMPVTSTSESFPALDLAVQLFRRLELSSVRYCHWKSNQSLGEALGGVGDLDLLVDPRDSDRFKVALAGLGFKQAEQETWQRQTSVVHYFGYDVPSGRLLHLHVYFRLVTGGQILKNYRLPVESMILEHCHVEREVVVPDRHIELLVFVLRKLIEAGGLLELALQHRDRARVARELQWLLPAEDHECEATMNRASAALRACLPYFDEDLWRAGVAALRESRSLVRRFVTGRRFRRMLRPCAIHRRWTALWQTTYRASRYLCDRFRKQRTRKYPTTGGKVIALVGPEASGKSTSAEAIRVWLWPGFAVRCEHMGKPQVTWSGRMANRLRKLRRWLQARRASSSTEGTSPKSCRYEASWAYACASLLLARERFHAARRAFRDASRGVTVVCDRYPIDRPGAVDGPRILADAGRGIGATLWRLLARLEQDYYRRIPQPDIVVELDVPVDLARQRNRDRVKVDKEGDEYLVERYTQFHASRRSLQQLYRVDARRPEKQVQSDLRGIIWRHL